ncbi:MAG: peptide chain release factor N(5)-glutamine methyltransferase, partial [Gemmatimonadota bacterium]
SRARFEALYLLGGCLGEGAAEVAAWPERTLEAAAWAEFRRRVTRRARGEPLQYIEGRAAFRELSLRVDRRALIPRPETEELVEIVLEWSRGRSGLAALDLGTGSGAVALSLALEGPFERVVAVDISPAALNLAEENAREAACGTRVEFRAGALFDPLRPEERFDVIVSNPPYVAAGDVVLLAAEVREWEPPAALFAGPTGLEVLERIADRAASFLGPGGLLALEVGAGQARAVSDRLRRTGGFVGVSAHRDAAGQERIVRAERAGGGG